MVVGIAVVVPTLCPSLMDQDRIQIVRCTFNGRVSLFDLSIDLIYLFLIALDLALDVLSVSFDQTQKFRFDLLFQRRNEDRVIGFMLDFHLLILLSEKFLSLA